MAAIDVTKKLLKAWYEMLNGNISVPVYRTDVPASQEGNRVLLRVESETDNSNNSKVVTNPIIITDVFTKFSVAIKDGVAADIDGEIASLLWPSPGQCGLPAQSGIQITEAIRESANYLAEDDQAGHYYRIVRRNRHRVVQLDETLGAEQITNGSFTGNANGWSLGPGWGFAFNKVRFQAQIPDPPGYLLQSGTLDETKTYRVSFSVSDDVGEAFSGFVGVYLGNNLLGVFFGDAQDVTIDGTWVNGLNKIQFFPSYDFNGYIDDVSVKEIL